MVCRDSRSGAHKGSEWILERSHNMTESLVNVEDLLGIEPCLYVKKLSRRGVLPVRECESAAGYNMTTNPCSWVGIGVTDDDLEPFILSAKAATP